MFVIRHVSFCEQIRLGMLRKRVSRHSTDRSNLSSAILSFTPAQIVSCLIKTAILITVRNKSSLRSWTWRPFFTLCFWSYPISLPVNLRKIRALKTTCRCQPKSDWRLATPIVFAEDFPPLLCILDVGNSLYCPVPMSRFHCSHPPLLVEHLILRQINYSGQIGPGGITASTRSMLSKYHVLAYP